jgi:hypothetical protein
MKVLRDWIKEIWGWIIIIGVIALFVYGWDDGVSDVLKYYATLFFIVFVLCMADGKKKGSNGSHYERPSYDADHESDDY